MQIIKGRERIAESCFYIGITLQVLVMVFAQTVIELPFASRFLHVAFVFFGLKILGTYYTKIEWIFIVLFGLLGIASYWAIGEEKAICIIVTIVAAKTIDMSRVTRYLFWTVSVASVITIFIALLGFGEPLLDTRDYGRGSIESRWGFGLGHANNFHGMVWYLITLLFLGYQKVLLPKHYMGLSCLNVVLFIVTASRTGFLLAQVVIIAGWLLYYDIQWIQKTWVYIASYISVVALVVLTIIGGNREIEFNGIMIFLNRVLSGRLEYVRWWADISTWRILDAKGPGNLIDNGVARLFSSNGYLIAIVYLIVTLWLIAYLQKHRSKFHFVCFVVLVCNFFYAFMEATFSFNNDILLNLFYIILMMVWTKLLPWNNEETYERV